MKVVYKLILGISIKLLIKLLIIIIRYRRFRKKMWKKGNRMLRGGY
ncbi:unnamed protein product [Paramecium primaurelia]|uniref:Uncharacterized protein n=1 Tax=Paramecium primaurelia TaxID=5886 RepID=A0A8S1M966_PARPR|nr:unnamed protein product [Paramecium primaurelia]